MTRNEIILIIRTHRWNWNRHECQCRDPRVNASNFDSHVADLILALPA